MSFCRSSKEVGSIDEILLSGEAQALFGKLSVDEIIMSIRNGSAYSFLDDDGFSEGRKADIMDVVEELREFLTINGFIRPEIGNVSTPEIYFGLEYIIGLDLAGDNEYIFFPYFITNEDYECYMFCYERMEGVFEILSEILNEEEMYEVLVNVMYMDSDCCDNEILGRAKKKIEENKGEIIPKFEKVYASF